MGLFSIFKKKSNEKNTEAFEKVAQDTTIAISEAIESKMPENAKVVYSSEIPEWTNLGNLITEKRYEEAIELGKKILEKNPESAGAHIELMDAYFKARTQNTAYFDLSTYHAKQAILYGHNTGYAHKRLAVNLEKSGKIHQAIQLCDLIISGDFSFCNHGCGNHEDYNKRRMNLLKKLDQSIDNKDDVLFTDDEVQQIQNRYDSINVQLRLNDIERWKNMNFVVGYTIKAHDTCCDLCKKFQGDYPKSFIWYGWHPKCKCDAIPIYKDREVENTVNYVPKTFLDWFMENRPFDDETTPYFIDENMQILMDSHSHHYL